MDVLAQNNVNTVYVDVWRFGYPYFRSDVFFKQTGLYSDPNLDEGRDVLQDMIAEGHRVGLEVSAWFEAGFAVCSGENTDLYTAHPEWFAERKDGTKDFYADGGIRYYWLSHCNREAQDFLIDLCREVASKYDVDGIEFDRVRYPELDCGYDSATTELYASEHNGAFPPANAYDSGWIKWRSEKLTEFMGRVYDSLKTINPDVMVSNAPLWYGYNQFCQDYAPWVNEGHLDFVETQMYFADAATYTSRLDTERQKLQDQTKLYPGISTYANEVITPPGELIKMISETRKRGIEGHVIWYSEKVLDYLDTLSATVYAEPAGLPFRESDWEREVSVIQETDTAVNKSVGWITYTNLPGLDGKCLYTSGSKGDWIDYLADIPRDGWYEIYVYLIYHWNAHTAAEYLIFSAEDTNTVIVNQNIEGNQQWFKLGDFRFNSGAGQKILRLSDKNIGSHILFTDAVMREEKWISCPPEG